MLLMDGQQTGRLIFRLINYSDYDQWLEFFKDPVTSRHWIYEKSDPETECSNWYAYQFERYASARGGMNALVEKDTGKLVGHCGLLKQSVDDNNEVEIAYSLLPRYWNRGYATEAAIKCRHHAFENMLASSLISIVSITNIPSQQVAIKVGMTIDKTTIYKGNKVNIFRVSNTTI
ncbi:MAG: GNAT family N-acetyltransferase [Agriterribacter sp.]